jgi:DNA repair photolyase
MQDGAAQVHPDARRAPRRHAIGGVTPLGRASPNSEGGCAARRGRGAVSNASGRYERDARVAIDDGWGSLDTAPPPLQTTVGRDASRVIIARNASPDVGFDRSINPYRGCEHGCSYCFARPTHAWLGLSPGLDFESKLFAKPEAAALLTRELRDPKYCCAPITIGANTDPYQPIERTLGITRQVIEVLAAFNHPLAIITKSALVARDIDLLAPLAARRLAKVFVSVTTLDRTVARRMEPRAATPERRLETVRALSEAGVPVGVMVAPVVPGITDHEIEAILTRAKEAGASEAGYVLLRLPLEIKQLWREWLEANYPDRAAKAMTLIRSMHGGRDYDPAFGRRQTGTGPYAQLIGQRFRQAVKRLGLNAPRAALDVSQFKPPPLPGDQLALF